MSETSDPVEASLASLARSTRSAAPRPVPFAVVRILAERRRAEFRSRRLLAFVALASAAPMLIVLVAWGLRPAAASGSLLAASVLALAVVPAIDGIGRLAGTRVPVATSLGHGSPWPS
ncbi:MAG TPA: hypothetical protein PLB01_01080 [Thermoanaerobaculia bacterium]|nr:hypothetical protein [Thermoanaerobaculia bacterium]